MRAEPVKIIVKRKCSTGFTLIELLVVLAITAVLAALLLSGLSQAKAREQGIQCVGNLHQLGAGLQIILENEHGYPVSYGSTNGDHSRSWLDQMEHDGFGISKPSNINFHTAGIWVCPSARWSDGLPFEYHSSYGYNALGVVNAGDAWEFPEALGLQGRYPPRAEKYPPLTTPITEAEWVPISTPISEAEVVNPSEMMAIGDDFYGGILFRRGPLTDFEKHGNVDSRHQSKANVVFCDGHVESPTLKYLFEDTSDEALSRWNRDHQPHRDKL